MPQTHDVMLNGMGYMLVPGSYEYQQGGAEIAEVRTGVNSFATEIATGDGPAVADRDGVRWVGVGMMAGASGLGDGAGRMILGPAELTVNTGSGANFDADSCLCIYQGVVYFSAQQFLYKVTVDVNGNYTGITYVGAAAGKITSMAVINGLLCMACASPATTMSNYAGTGAIVNTPAAVARIIWHYAGGIWRSKANADDTISGSIDGGATWTQWQLDSTVKSACAWRGRATGGGVMLIGTRNRLWELVGQWSGSPAAFAGTVSPVFDGTGGGAADDFAYLMPYRGDVFTQYAGVVHRWDGAHLRAVPGAPRGNVTGMCAAGGLLVVSMYDPSVVWYALWAYDGARWLLLSRSGAPPSYYNRIGGTDGLVNDGHILSLDSGTQYLSRWELPTRGFSAHPAATGAVIVGPLDAGQGDTVKTWTKLVCAWSTALYPYGGSAPANPGGVLALDYSVDDGVNWIAAGTTSIAAGGRSQLIEQEIAAGVGIEAHRLLARATWTPTSAYAGLQINGIWAAGWRVKDAPRLESWTFAVRCSDRLLARDGSVDARTGQAMLQTLRTLAQSGGVATFRDLDYDLNARTVNVRVLGMKERAKKGDGARFTETTVRLTVGAVS